MKRRIILPGRPLPAPVKAKTTPNAVLNPYTTCTLKASIFWHTYRNLSLADALACPRLYFVYGSRRTIYVDGEGVLLEVVSGYNAAVIEIMLSFTDDSRIYYTFDRNFSTGAYYVLLGQILLPGQSTPHESD